MLSWADHHGSVHWFVSHTQTHTHLLIPVISFLSLSQALMLLQLPPITALATGRKKITLKYQSDWAAYWTQHSSVPAGCSCIDFFFSFSFSKSQHCWSMKATWWHILEPFEPIRVMYVCAARCGIVSDTFEWRRVLSFFRIIRKTSQAMTGGGGGGCWGVTV